MSPEQWKAVEERLSGRWCSSVRLLIDGYNVSLEVVQAAPLRYEIMVFVNGLSRGQWLLSDCEERRRFLRPVKATLFKPTQKAKLTKGLSKRALAQMRPHIDKTLTHYYLTWSSFGPLKRHLISNNRSIELAPEPTDAATGD